MYPAIFLPKGIKSLPLRRHRTLKNSFFSRNGGNVSYLLQLVLDGYFMPILRDGCVDNGRLLLILKDHLSHYLNCNRTELKKQQKRCPSDTHQMSPA
ncbi:unnamed protein product [Protopolystoma xenopodis]|uniref:Uncharacterized protein n=1 Tax=Protopolystoma xenopodis TaxID=117903 RepID=A0A448WVL4_9PLAT|nr:unnamed protein product [Protopolystoma xenopodis]